MARDRRPSAQCSRCRSCDLDHVTDSSPETTQLRAFAVRRQQIVQMIVAELTPHHPQNRRAMALKQNIPIRTQIIDKHIRSLERDLGKIDHDINDAIRSSPDMARDRRPSAQCSRSGVVSVRDFAFDLDHVTDSSPRTGLSGSPPGGRSQRRVGVAPMNRDSGTFRGRRMIVGGRAPVRRALYMATLVAIRHNPSIAVVYQRLRHSGKRPKVAITACMRKLLTILNAIARDRVSWRQELPCA